ncbi:hypothetical protein NL676_036610 [Syzygium grande]|nr:hypothetical protein NL676_036610 [Syzygium grande]
MHRFFWGNPRLNWRRFFACGSCKGGDEVPNVGVAGALARACLAWQTLGEGARQRGQSEVKRSHRRGSMR